MGQCIQMLEKIAVEVLAAAKDIKGKDWAQLIPIAIEIAKDAYADYECFKNNTPSVSQVGLDFVLNTSGDQKQCIMEHLQNVINDVSELPSDVFHGKWDAASDAISNASDEIQAALNC